MQREAGRGSMEKMVILKSWGIITALTISFCGSNVAISPSTPATTLSPLSSSSLSSSSLSSSSLSSTSSSLSSTTNATDIAAEATTSILSSPTLSPSSTLILAKNSMTTATANTTAEVTQTYIAPSSTSNVTDGMTSASAYTISPSPTKAPTAFWDMSVAKLGNLWSFVIMVVAIVLCLILFVALVCMCHKYNKLKKRTKFPTDVIINNESAWINSNDDLLMWERNLRATEMNPTGITNGNRPNGEMYKK